MAHPLQRPDVILQASPFAEILFLVARPPVNTTSAPRIIHRPEFLINSFLSISLLFRGKNPYCFPVKIKRIDVAILVNGNIRGYPVFLKLVRCCHH